MKLLAPLCPWKAAALVPLLMSLVSLTRSSEYEYETWRPPIYGKQPQCMDIPDDLRLCHGVGYSKMMLPNLLEHETMAEVKQQAGSWVPLVYKNCHPSTQVFLCSLFTPICLDQPIYPCRQLCEDVRDRCAPIMEAFGFPWPEMLTCNKFPQSDVCISAPNNSTADAPHVSPICPPCDHEVDAILDHICASEFVIKTKIKEVVREGPDRKVFLQKKKKAVKLGPLKKKDLKKLILYLKNGADCPCAQLDNLSSNYLIMGRKADRQHIITGIHKWDKSSKDFKQTMKKLKSHKCPTFENVFK
ncbi:secreted frizzled-related protein 1a [Salminus brasiliensis]|uniref:secreted frizzled-related protein 1a n=1 Tax=Salminus brasiliensis TaxID=930266 RepID=UPI003B838558